MLVVGFVVCFFFKRERPRWLLRGALGLFRPWGGQSRVQVRFPRSFLSLFIAPFLFGCFPAYWVRPAFEVVLRAQCPFLPWISINVSEREVIGFRGQLPVLGCGYRCGRFRRRLVSWRSLASTGLRRNRGYRRARVPPIDDRDAGLSVSAPLTELST